MLYDLLKRNEELEARLRQVEAERNALQAERSALQTERSVLQAERLLLKLQVEKLKHLLYGRRSEKIPAKRDDGLRQDELFEEAVHEIRTEESEEKEIDTPERQARRARRKPIPKELPRRRVVIDVDPEMRRCPDCGEEMQCIGEDISEQLEYIPALLMVIEYALKKYACKKCQTGVIMERVPERPIKKGRPGPGLLAYVLVSKYQDHLPLNRIERIFDRYALGIRRSTLCDWVQASAELLRPIIEAMKRELFRARVIQADETPVQVQDRYLDGKTRRSYIWIYGIPRGEVVYDFTPGRSSDGPMGFLGDYEGYLQTDAYAGYNANFRTGRVTHIGCWAHARRKIFESQAEDPEYGDLLISAIQKLYRIERKAKESGIEGEALVALRRQESRPILDQIKEILELKRRLVLPQSGMGTAIAYTLDQWDALERYVDVAEAEIDNNGAERGLRGVVIGRKNWLFIGHPEAGPRAAIILSLIETCRRLGIEPFEYLKDVLTELPKDPARAASMTPRLWLASRSSGGSENSANGPAQ